MKTFHKILLLCVGMILLPAAFISCEWAHTEDPDHPLYVSYSITASNLQFNGPALLLTDIKSWIKENQVLYDVQVNYTTGEASEFAKTDADAIQKYEEFVPKFKAYLKEVSKDLAAGKYPDMNPPVTATFSVYAARIQGQDGNLKYDQIDFVYPDSSGELQ